MTDLERIELENKCWNLKPSTRDIIIERLDAMTREELVFIRDMLDEHFPDVTKREQEKWRRKVDAELSTRRRQIEYLGSERDSLLTAVGRMRISVIAFAAGMFAFLAAQTILSLV